MAKEQKSKQEAQAARGAKKADAFKRLAGKRVTKALAVLHGVSALSNRNSYAYDSGQVAKIMTALRGAVENVGKSFESPAAGKAGFEL